MPGSGGAGQHRGGLGIIRDYEHLAERSVIGGYVQQTRPDTAPWGLAGGGPGGKAAMQINPGKPNEKRLKSKVIGEVLRKGDVLRLVGAGGGGWGDPRNGTPNSRSATGMKGSHSNAERRMPDPATITGYHAHIYYAPETRVVAERIREVARHEFHRPARPLA